MNYLKAINVLSSCPKLWEIVICTRARKFFLAGRHNIFSRWSTEGPTSTSFVFGVKKIPRAIHIFLLLIIGTRPRCFPASTFIIGFGEFYFKDWAVRNLWKSIFSVRWNCSLRIICIMRCVHWPGPGAFK